ncbi:MAG: hypothetical protein H8E46_03945 [FCB group bacterium]|nr:hypothetical protein [FCB group bacterium]
MQAASPKLQGKAEEKRKAITTDLADQTDGSKGKSRFTGMKGMKRIKAEAKANQLQAAIPKLQGKAEAGFPTAHGGGIIGNDKPCGFEGI